jgi:hypothetical protein
MKDVGQEMQRVAEAHLSACQEALWAEESGASDEEIPESPACGPFCGCDTCQVRETLFAAWPVVEAHFLGEREKLLTTLELVKAEGGTSSLQARRLINELLLGLAREPGEFGDCPDDPEHQNEQELADEVDELNEVEASADEGERPLATVIAFPVGRVARKRPGGGHNSII